jgi:acetyl-CoA carboxylase carboxyltransferase component
VPFEKELEELKRRAEKALEMGGPDKVKRQHDQGKLTARERIARLLDPEAFLGSLHPSLTRMYANDRFDLQTTEKNAGRRVSSMHWPSTEY